jgi:GNAT superfamily N-acetyltransferase
VADWVIERLNRSHERGAFCCGNAPLDNFLQTLVTQYEKRRLGRTVVATAAGENKVLGYYTAAAGSFAVSSLPEAARKKLPKHPLPTVHLGRLAVDLSCQGKGLGEALLFHFLEKAVEVSDELGVFAVDVWATDEPASRFYLKYGFIRLEDAPFHLYLPIATVEQMFSR